MNRLFGRGKPKEPGPSISDCITGVSIANLEMDFERKAKILCYCF